MAQVIQYLCVCSLCPGFIVSSWVMAAGRCCCCLWPSVLLLLRVWPGLLAAEQVAVIEIFLEQRPGVSALLQGELLVPSEGSWISQLQEDVSAKLQGELVLMSLSEGVVYENTIRAVFKEVS